MGGSSAGSQVGLIYTGDWKDEPLVTVVSTNQGGYNVCVKESPIHKRIAAISEPRYKRVIAEAILREFEQSNVGLSRSQQIRYDSLMTRLVTTIGERHKEVVASLWKEFPEKMKARNVEEKS